MTNTNTKVATPPTPTSHRLEMIGRSQIRIKPLPEGRVQTFKGFQPLVDFLNKNKIRVTNPDVLPPFYQTMLQ